MLNFGDGRPIWMYAEWRNRMEVRAAVIIAMSYGTTVVLLLAALGLTVVLSGMLENSSPEHRSERRHRREQRAQVPAELRNGIFGRAGQGRVDPSQARTADAGGSRTAWEQAARRQRPSLAVPRLRLPDGVLVAAGIPTANGSERPVPPGFERSTVDAVVGADGRPATVLRPVGRGQGTVADAEAPATTAGTQEDATAGDSTDASDDSDDSDDTD